MLDAGVVITIGSDSARMVEGSLPGNIRRERELLVESGFSNYQALATGTRNAAKIIKRMERDSNFGMVKTGNSADPLLLRQNPLQDISSTRHRTDVMVRGMWFTQAELDGLVDSFVATC